ncbi:MAG: HAMP domain-containing histidine kinase [Clostridia bacterium]|nr:HAMP domain-containing histidine kinase [Clostridia bacterium]
MKKHKIGFRIRFFLEVGAIIAACLVGISIINSQLLEKVYISNVENTLEDIAREVERAGEDYFLVLSQIETNEDVSIDLYDETDNMLYEGGGSFVSGDRLNIVSRKENKDGSYFNVVAAEGSSTQYILYGKDFENGYHIEVFTEKNPIEENASVAVKVTTSITVLTLALALIFIFDYSRRFSKPFIQMNEVMEKIAGLDFSQRTDIDRNDEIGTLAKNINKVSDSLDNALTELREKNKQLQADIEKERRIEKMRQDFVSAASHELKTPIAIIRGYAEGLRMNASDSDASTGEYSDIIMNEADKMNELVLSMLEQSLYTSGQKAPEKELFDVDKYIRDFLKTVNPIVEEKGITVSYEGCEAEAFADRKQMTRVLSNIFLNACSHVKDEMLIEISVENEGEATRVSVFNTGSFISDKDKDGIFTSFYRADKAHSRKEGRFGLGLAIVKSIIDNHGCQCGFENKENGVSFYFTMKNAEENKENKEENYEN